MQILLVERWAYPQLVGTRCTATPRRGLKYHSQLLQNYFAANITHLILYEELLSPFSLASLQAH